MKVEQQAEFKPITITLETRAEAMAIWTALSRTDVVKPNDIEWETGYAALKELSDWFSNQAHF